MACYGVSCQPGPGGLRARPCLGRPKLSCPVSGRGASRCMEICSRGEASSDNHLLFFHLCYFGCIACMFSVAFKLLPQSKYRIIIPCYIDLFKKNLCYIDLVAPCPREYKLFCHHASNRVERGSFVLKFRKY